MRNTTRNFLSTGVICLFVIVCLYLYGSIDKPNVALSQTLQQEKEINALKSTIDNLQTLLKSNHDKIASLKQQIADYERSRKLELDKEIEKENELYDEKAKAKKALEEQLNQSVNDVGEEEHKGVIPEPNRGNKVAVVHGALHKTTSTSSSSTCQLRSNYSNARGDVQMLDLYNVLDFENRDGGVWKQGWDITYDQEKVTKEKTLEVIVIPHSHCDPGWKRTFEEYHASQTTHILDGMARHLGSDLKDMRFIYAEISFFELWWREKSDAVRDKVKQLLATGQLEIVTGGWVMTDEANAHYFSIIAELLEGHEWLKNHIAENFAPKSHWSIDPFGLSPTLPYLLSIANITNAAIQRVHYSVKKHLAKNKQLEFMWRQLWGAHGMPDVRTHMFPFYSYDVPHSCGPDPSICCQFDFRRFDEFSCPWMVNPQKITDTNVRERAYTLYDQYRKKSQLYKTNVLLVPLGDDFRYDQDREWTAQYENYKKLFEEMNSRKEWNINARFGTLSDYFVELDRSLRSEAQSLPILSGDFFTYADRDDHYWSGYFTSRPFYKQMDRTLVHHLRAAEIAFSLRSMKGKPYTDEVFDKLVQARRALSVFQHHDGVTGTAKARVMVDYGNKMLTALRGTEQILSVTLSDLISMGSGATTSLVLDEYREDQSSLPKKRIYKIGDFVVLFNTLSRTREEPVCIYVQSLSASVKASNVEVQQQLSPAFELQNGHLVNKGLYELCFVDVLSQFGVNVYEVVDSSASASAKQRPVIATISARKDLLIDGFRFEPITSATISLKNSQLEALFDSSTGFLKAVRPTGHRMVDVDVHFVHYGVREYRSERVISENRSGAYLFLPDGPAKDITRADQEFVLVDGPIMKKVFVAGPQDLEILQVYSLAHDSPSVEIINEVDIRSKNNFELAMRLNTNVESGKDIYTDLNGLQIIRRQRQLNKLPLQAHFYPMPSSAYIEDRSTRISILSAQPLGVSSLKEGQIEVMLDRRLDQDDGRGLEESVRDNHRTTSQFRLLVEPLQSFENKNAAEERVGYHSLTGLWQSLQLQYPVVRMLSTAKLNAAAVPGMPISLPCDIHAVNLRTLAGPTRYAGNRLASPLNDAALILHRPLTDCRSKLKLRPSCKDEGNTVTIERLFPSVRLARKTSLTLLYEGEKVTQVTMEPQDVTTVKLSCKLVYNDITSPIYKKFASLATRFGLILTAECAGVFQLLLTNEKIL